MLKRIVMNSYSVQPGSSPIYVEEVTCWGENHFILETDLKGLANRNALKNMSVFSSWKLKHITECFSCLILDFRVRQLTGGCLECFKFLKLLLWL